MIELPFLCTILRIGSNSIYYVRLTGWMVLIELKCGLQLLLAMGVA